jgi:hypothetical protein
MIKIVCYEKLGKLIEHNINSFDVYKDFDARICIHTFVPDVADTIFNLTIKAIELKMNIYYAFAADAYFYVLATNKENAIKQVKSLINPPKAL